MGCGIQDTNVLNTGYKLISHGGAHPPKQEPVCIIKFESYKKQDQKKM
jgi:hypothetical protein